MTIAPALSMLIMLNSNPSTITGSSGEISSEVMMMSLGILIAMGLAAISCLVILIVKRSSFKKLLSVKRFMAKPTGFQNTGWSIVFLAAVSFLSVSLIGYLISDPSAVNPITRMVSGGDASTILFAFLIIGVVAPLIEEIVFRGAFLYSAASFIGKSGAALLTIAVFAIWHAYSFGYIITILPASIILTLAATRSGSLIPGILIHMIHNATATGIVIFLL